MKYTQAHILVHGVGLHSPADLSVKARATFTLTNVANAFNPVIITNI